MPRPQPLLIPITLLMLSCATSSANRVAIGPQATYYAYVGAESADLIHRIRFGPGGASIDKTIPVGELSLETEGPHALMSSPDGEYLYMTTGHGFPDGKLWKFHAGPDTLVSAPILLGRFPATVDLTPDGLYAFVANFNLHGEKVPSTVSVVYTPDMIEVAQIDTCTQPHGLRVGPRGTHLYTNCIQDDQLVEVDTRTFEVSRRFSVAIGFEGSIAEEAYRPEDHMRPGQAKNPSCAPTWAEPSPDGSKVYVACNRGDVILEIDTRDWVLLRKLPTGRGIYNLDITPDGKMLVGTLKQGAGVEFFDLESWASVGIVESSTTITHGVAITPDSRFAFVSAEGVGAEPGKVDIYDLRTMRRVGEVEVGQQAGGIVFWRMERMDR
ncbi:MAG: YncE family protein [Gemmatimonadetes bacterium]|nr:YncE family protein [Gemmatimonadota bacterium]